ncbi:MAG: 1-phosphofructokinase [Clostridia bacterium]|nr:1-phosphofructokinase [Clostridia bacterium]
MILTVTANPAIDRVYFVDQFILGEVHRPQKCSVTAGGKGLNVAKVATMLGTPACAMGFVGGYNGAYIRREVERLGIEAAFTEIAEETRINVNVTDHSGRSSEILEAGPTVSAEERARFMKDFARTLPRASVAVASGSLPRGLDADFYCELISLARQSGVRLIVDTSGAALERVIHEKPFMIKPNTTELSALFGTELCDTDHLKYALRTLAERGVEIPLLTLGADGAMALIGDRYYKFTPPRVKAINTVGSGDSTVSGIAVGLDRGMDMISAIRLGMAAGVANTQFAATGMVSQELVEKYYEQIEIEEV